MTIQQKLVEHIDAIVPEVRAYVTVVTSAVAKLCRANGRIDTTLLDRHQRAVHGLAWAATTAEAVVRTAEWGARLAGQGMIRKVDEHAICIGLAEYLSQLAGGIPMSQSEIFRPHELGQEAAKAAAALADNVSVRWFIANGGVEARAALVAEYRQGSAISEAVFDQDLDLIREQFRRFTEREIIPYAQAWHLADELIPDALVAQLGDLGAFGVCIDPAFGGMGLGKLAMCIVTEELSRGWIGAGSLGTRSEIAGELISNAGTPEQKAQWLPRIASGEVLPTAVFTEPDAGSDLASLRTRATPSGSNWRIDGSKTWITHAARSDLMTILARSEADVAGHNGLSIFLAPKPRGTEMDPFPATGMSGGEIQVLGYRGMKEYEIGFDGFLVPEKALLGGVRGQGFRQLMQTFEGARIQTAARAVGVGCRAFDLAWRYAGERKQFRRPIVEFPRVSDKLAMMIAETAMARQITYFAALEKDKGHRCDIDAGMAKLLAARVAWSNADAGVQIHGGNGYALEFEISRILCDARILNVFEGAAEIQAQVIGRGLLAKCEGEG